MTSDDDIFIKLIDLPSKVHGLTTPNADGSYTVFLNTNDTHERRHRAFLHECKHIYGDDFYKDNINDIEIQARKTGDNIL